MKNTTKEFLSPIALLLGAALFLSLLVGIAAWIGILSGGFSTAELEQWLERPVSEVKTWHLLLCIYAIAVLTRSYK